MVQKEGGTVPMGNHSSKANNKVADAARPRAKSGNTPSTDEATPRSGANYGALIARLGNIGSGGGSSSSSASAALDAQNQDFSGSGLPAFGAAAHSNAGPVSSV